MSDAEILVEGEPWTGLVVVALAPGPSNIGLVRAENWCRLDEDLILWRGPYKRDETVKRSNLTEITCRTVLVDENGFYRCVPDEGPERLYPCQEIDFELEAAIEAAAEKLLNQMANERAAESHSYIDREDAAEQFGEDVYAIATFGDAVAVNGESRLKPHVKHPPRWKLTDIGGRIPVGEESEFDKNDLAATLSYQLTDELKTPVDRTTIKRILNRHFGGKGYIYWSSDSGDSEVWVSPKAMRAYEKAQEEEEKRKEEDRRRKREEERKQRQEEERRAAEEARRKIQKGGFPFPKDWSPKGEVP